ncbi:MAG: hypothetical protein JW993_14735, partial [Sedimentisphaerales bacterium]|nr:hypothetical protein [Sedimentisphaerales bacterium]
IEPNQAKRALVIEQIDKRVNTVNTSSLGRVFDVVAGLLGLGTYNHFDAQLPMALESIAAPDVEDSLPFDLIREGDEPVKISLRRTFRELVDEIRRRRDEGELSAMFHNTLAEALVALAEAARTSTNLETVALSGGVFCNRYLANRVITRLGQAGFTVLCNQNVPANDGGIALGQAAIAVRIAGN